VTIDGDDSWRAATGPILASDLYNGETYDARLEMLGWSSSGFDDGSWAAVRLFAWGAELVSPAGPPVRRIETVDPITIGKSPSGKTILDFGQNLAGRLRMRVDGKSGTQVTLRHAEILQGRWRGGVGA
jgi:alpha-L-rhamnosidase